MPEQDVALHKALLTGLLSRIGRYDAEQRSYVGARQTRFVIHPSSALAKKPPAWIMAFELVQTTQLFARTVARIEPTWLETIGAHLLKRSYSDPHWSEKSARASVREHATLFGLPVLKDRSIDYATLAPGRARLIFIEHALVRGEYESRGAFQAKNRALLAEVARLRDKARRSEMLADPDALLGFFDRRVPESVVNGKTFERWREEAERAQPDLLVLSLEDVLAGEHELSPSDYPDRMTLEGVPVELEYRFEPSADDDGVTLRLPLALLARLDPARMEWTIPAWRREKVALLLESLPRASRRDLGDAQALARSLLEGLVPFEDPLLEALAAGLRARGLDVQPSSFRLEAIPPYLRFNYRLLGERGNVLAETRDLGRLLDEQGRRAREAFARAAAAAPWCRAGFTSWSFGELPDEIRLDVLGTTLPAYPALADRGASVDTVLEASRREAERVSIAGVARLATFAARAPIASMRRRMPPPLFAQRTPLPSRAQSEAFAERLVLRVAQDAFGLHPGGGPLPRNAAELDARVRAGVGRLEQRFEAWSQVIRTVAAELDKTQRALEAARRQPSATHALRDLSAQLEHLLPEDGLLTLELERLAHFPRYLRAMQTRLSRALLDPRKDADKAAPLEPLWREFLAKAQGATDRDAARALRWAFEELRVSIFAPELRAAMPVSVAHVSHALAALR